MHPIVSGQGLRYCMKVMGVGRIHLYVYEFCYVIYRYRSSFLVMPFIHFIFNKEIAVANENKE